MEINPELTGHLKSQRPARDLLLQLPLLEVNSDHEIDYAASDPAVLQQIASNAEICQQAVQLGLSAIGHLLARSAPEIEFGEIPGDLIEALGFLMAELGDFASVAHCLATACRRYTTDYIPTDPRRMPNVKP